MLVRLCVGRVALALSRACAAAAARRRAAAGTPEPDKFLFDKGTEALNDKKWLTARESSSSSIDTYTAEPVPPRREARHRRHLSRRRHRRRRWSWRSTSSASSCRSTRRNRRADYAQYKLGMAHFRQMRAPQRDQTETRDAIKEFETFVERYPNSSLMPEAKAQAARGARSPERMPTTRSATSTTASDGIRARSIASRRC